MGGTMMPFKIFISCSRPTSKKIANALKKLLNGFFGKRVKCWIAEKDIPAGTGWYNKINENLSDANFGILCFTMENLDAEWLLFEGGALVTSIFAKGKGQASVCSYLFGVKAEQVPEPFRPLQGVTADHEGTKNLFESINELLGKPIDESSFGEFFDFIWVQHSKDFPAECPSLIGELHNIAHPSTMRILDELKVPANPCAELLFIDAYRNLFNNFSVKDSIATFKAPASTYPNYLRLLLVTFGYPVKAIAIVDDEEHFWRGAIGDEILKYTSGTSQRVFVFKDRKHLEENFDFFLRHAHNYNVYAISYANLVKKFFEYKHDFSIIGTPETKIFARYEPISDIESIMFTAEPQTIAIYENAFSRIISNSVKMEVSPDPKKEITEDQKEKFINDVFGEVVMTPLPHVPVEMSLYISVPQYAQFEEGHEYFIEMMETMRDNFDKRRDAKTPCRVLELGAGTGHFTKRLMSLENVSVTAVEIDWACYSHLKDTLGQNAPNDKLRVVNEDSRTFADSDGKLFDFIFSSFADHHIKQADKELYFKNIKKNLSQNGVLIVGDEFIPSYDHRDKEAFKSAVIRYHNHIIEKAREKGHKELVELETAAMNSGLERRGDFKMPIEEYENHLHAAGLFPISKEKIGPIGRDDLGGIYVYVIGTK